MSEIHIPIAAPPWSKLGSSLESAVRKALFDFSLLEGVDSLSIALSGGKDSLSMLYLLAAISGRGVPKFSIHAIHVEGEFSCGAGIDQNFLKAICDKLGVNFIVKRSTQTLENLECYSCSRERRKLLFDAAKEVGAPTIAFGHHRDDSAQTVLLNLLQKGEFKALLPKLKMIDYDITIIRPLIYVAEQDLRLFAEKYAFQRHVCQCPRGKNSKRFEADKILSYLEEGFPNARNNIASAGLNYGSKKATRK